MHESPTSIAGGWVDDTHHLAAGLSVAYPSPRDTTTSTCGPHTPAGLQHHATRAAVTSDVTLPHHLLAGGWTTATTFPPALRYLFQLPRASSRDPVVAVRVGHSLYKFHSTMAAPVPVALPLRHQYHIRCMGSGGRQPPPSLQPFYT